MKKILLFLSGSMLMWNFSLAPVNAAPIAATSTKAPSAQALAKEGEYLQNAKQAINKKQYNKAITLCDKAILVNPKGAEAYRLRSRGYAGLGNPQRAKADFDQAVQLGYRPVSAKQLSPTRMSSPKLASSGRRTGPRMSPPKKASSNIGSLLYNPMGVIRRYDDSIRLNPYSANNYYGRGRAYANLDNYQQAISDFSRAIQLDALNALFYYERGRAQAKLKNYQLAIEDYTRAIELNPSNSYAYAYRADAYQSLGDYQQAELDMNRAIELNPQLEQ